MVQSLERARPPGRNDPCPCGSGKKYKRCCLLQEAPIGPSRQFDDVIADIYTADEYGDRDAAIRILEEARHDLHNADLDGMLVERYLEYPADEAEVLLRRWWEQEHDRFSGTGLATLLTRANRKTEALEVLGTSQGTDAWPEYWRLLGVLRDEQGDIHGGVAAMELYARLVPEDVDAWLTLADMQQRGGYNDRSLHSLRRAGDAAPNRILPRLQRIRLLAEEGRWREVRDLGESLLDTPYDDTADDIVYDLQMLLAQAYFVLGDFDSARARWQRLLEEQPQNSEVCYHLAHLEWTARRYRAALLTLERYPDGDEARALDLHFRCLLALHEYQEAEQVAIRLEHLDPASRVLPLVQAAQAVSQKEYHFALKLLAGAQADRYQDTWHNLRLDCLAHTGLWHEVLPTLKLIDQADEAVLFPAALSAMAAGKMDLAERLIAEIDDQQSSEVRSLTGILGLLRQQRRAAEVRRQQQVDQAEKQRRTLESRELRRKMQEVEGQNAALTTALADSEAAVSRLLDLLGVSLQSETPLDRDTIMQNMAARAHRDAIAQERGEAEARLRAMLGDYRWPRLSESVRISLREGERLFASGGELGYDYGSALMGYARGLESAFKDAIFAPARALWQKRPGPVARLQDEGHDPSLSPFVRYVLHGSHLTLGSMAAALERVGDARRDGIAVSLLREVLLVQAWDTQCLLDWKRTAERLSIAADARNSPAHAASVSHEEVRAFRELILGAGGLLQALGDL